MADILSKHLNHIQELNWIVTEQVIDKPYEMVFWYWEELWEATRSSKSSERNRELLRDFLEYISNLDPQGAKLAESVSTVTKVCVSDLWQLFRPGTWVLSRPYLDDPQFFRVKEIYYRDWYKDKELENYQRSFVVLVWSFGWTGTELRQEYYEFSIGYEQSEDEKKITDLPCYPVTHHRDDEEQYGSQAVEVLEKQVNDENIMIDFTGFERYAPDPISAIGKLQPVRTLACKCKLCFGENDSSSEWMSNFARTDRRADDDNRNYSLLPARALGYCLNSKVWAQLHVGSISHIETPKSDEIFEKVIFPEESDSVKEDLRILVEQHGSTKTPLISDPVAGKGSGLTILLHGPPGVGKTLTAEILAKAAGKPLYVVGASNIGVHLPLAEARLTRTFELAERWRAILLIDEADVFLDSRGSRGEADVTKNGLVSVMLRALEYYKGILIMTTNRVMTFDVAMLSRCHYAVNFKSLTLKQEKDIWKSYIAQLNDKNCFKKSEIEAWIEQITKKKTKLSGREIRNVFTVAQTLAQAEPNKKIMKQHLERVYDRLVEFLDAMEKNKTTQQALLNAAYEP
ncbi:MAG: hypothetical protein Q9195_006364 [Heterodermia aff. obscurata]